MSPLFSRPIMILLSLCMLSGCSSPEEKFIDAATREGSVTDPKVLSCAADNLQKEMSEERFSKLVEELTLIADKKKDKGDASIKLMGAYTLATTACAVGNLLKLDDGKEK
ncbi:MAG: hypothetical protein G3M70_07035 [Candidatus Nitronauta litoralis]|uniref:Lipoprotein n=1 Tax=Candidatus Nitronauta litoralis TaxID=2705533 RepID=A0A7T0G0B0_9BACT|nr:MAG: hypothetical protein G3M70_07035 [Candidatus Nitronauta litoralis]